MNAGRIAAALALLGFVLAAPTQAQGLGDTAARERAKRTEKAEAKKPEARVFTNEDLDRGKPPAAKSATGSGAAASSASSDSDSLSEDDERPTRPPPNDRQRDERGLRDQISGAQARVSAAEARIRELSGKLNPMSGDFIYGSGGSGDANEELRVREGLRESETELLAARQAVATASQNLQDFRRGRPASSPH